MKKVLVLGDPICDHNFYRAKRDTPDPVSSAAFGPNRPTAAFCFCMKFLERL
jgi:hypothetical protein